MLLWILSCFFFFFSCYLLCVEEERKNSEPILNNNVWFHSFSAFWLRSSVLSVLISLIMSVSMCYLEMMILFFLRRVYLVLWSFWIHFIKILAAPSSPVPSLFSIHLFKCGSCDFSRHPQVPYGFQVQPQCRAYPLPCNMCGRVIHPTASNISSWTAILLADRLLLCPCSFYNSHFRISVHVLCSRSWVTI